MSADLSPDGFRAWIGKSETQEEIIAPTPLTGLSACLDRDDPPVHDGDAVPPGWHWLYFLPKYKTAECGYDGHAKLGDSLPPIPFPRRMWAGGRLAFHAPLRVGEPARKVSTIKDVAIKEGRSGRLAFVVVRHEISGPSGLAIVEDHDIVYREASSSVTAPPPAPTDGDFAREISPSPLLLFRYSALTFNGHRIHYDRDFCRAEGYPGLVVHGPLEATLMLELVRDRFPENTIREFYFRAVSPLFDTEPFSVNGRATAAGVALWAASGGGALAMTGQAQLA
jgi:3-methylfumaryl-CoA hydratase